jgi:hypothetical protein
MERSDEAVYGIYASRKTDQRTHSVRKPKQADLLINPDEPGIRQLV